MNNKPIVPVLLTVVAALLWCGTWPTAASAASLVVSVNKTLCPNANYTRIQDAVNDASAGDTIRVCAGTYVEQVSIGKPLTIEADNGAVLMPAAMQANAASLFDGSPLATALLVEDTTGVTISGLTVDGANNGISECAPDLIGISYLNASGTLNHLAVRNFKLATSLNGCQSGTGIFVESGGGGASNVEIRHCTIHDFQKNGITADEKGTSAIIRRNVVTGVGPTNGAAQNGIQIGFSAGGSIVENTVTNNIYAPCTAVSTCSAVATNILVVQSDGVEVSDNNAGIGQVNLYVQANNARIDHNTTFATRVFDGIRVEGDQSRVRENESFNGAESGIFIFGNNTTVMDNSISEAGVGILEETGSTGNIIARNQFHNTPVKVQDPKLVDVAKLISPKR